MQTFTLLQNFYFSLDPSKSQVKIVFKTVFSYHLPSQFSDEYIIGFCTPNILHTYVMDNTEFLSKLYNSSSKVDQVLQDLCSVMLNKDEFRGSANNFDIEWSSMLWLLVTLSISVLHHSNGKTRIGPWHK